MQQPPKRSNMQKKVGKEKNDPRHDCKSHKEAKSKRKGGIGHRPSGFEEVSSWYKQCVQTQGHLYHKELILPKLKALLRKESLLLDFGCGQGVAYRALSSACSLKGYLGLDLSPSLLEEAQSLAEKEAARLARNAKSDSRSSAHSTSAPLWLAQDLASGVMDEKLQKTLELMMQEKSPHHDKAPLELLFLLSLQNMSNAKNALKTAGAIAKKFSSRAPRLHLVLNHPCFRIPRQTHWGYDREKKLQYRRLDHYSSSLEIPIHLHGADASIQKEHSMSYHFSMEQLFTFLTRDAGFVCSALEEWHSHKKSEGGKAKAENRARKEFPLFLYLQGRLSPSM